MRPPGFTLCVGEEGPPLEEFNLDVVIGMWFSYKLHDLASGLDQPKCKQEEGVASISYIGLDSIVMSHLEDEEEFKSLCGSFVFFIQ